MQLLRFLPTLNKFYIHTYCSGKNLMQCYPKGFRRLSIWKIPVKSCLNTLGKKFHRWKSYAMLSERLRTTLYKKKACTIWLNILETTLHKSKPYAMLPVRLNATLYKKNPVQCCLNTFKITLCSWKICAMLAERLQTTLHKEILCNKVLILLGKHCTAQDPMHCCLSSSRQHCIRKNLI